MEKKKVRQIRGLIIFTAIMVLVVLYFNSVLTGAAWVLKILQPFLVGGIIAFVLNLPMKAIETKILKRWKGKSADKLKRPVSLVLALLFIVLLIYILIQTVVPSLSATFVELGKKIPVFLSELLDKLEKLSAEYPDVLKQIQELEKMEIDWAALANNLFGFMKNGVGSVLTSTVSVAGSIISTVINVVVAVIFSIYILTQKEKLGSQGRKVLRAYCSEKVYTRVEKVLALLYHNFSNFVTGQCLEAVILGSMFVAVMLIFRMDYAVLVGVLVAFTALIPIVGAFIGCAVGAFLLAINDPMTAVWFVIMFLIIQQIEGNLIYPKVVGNSVGLPSIWVLVAVSVGGSLFGIPGILFFIPLVSTAYALLKEDVIKRGGTNRVQETGPESGSEPAKEPKSEYKK